VSQADDLERDGEDRSLRERLGDKEEWRFRRGRRFWGFWLMLGALALYLIVEYVVRPLVD